MDTDDPLAGEDRFSVWNLYKVPIVLGIISLFCISLSIFFFIKMNQSVEPIRFDQGSIDSSSSAVISYIQVDVAGAVVSPGVYRLAQGSRVDDAITSAGGFHSTADADRIAATINRAAKLVDGAKIYIPKKGEVSSSTVFSASSELVAVGSVVNVNTATASELEALSGIGPATAQKIIDHRPYMTIEELVSKKAMGQALFDKLKDQLGI